MKAANLIWVTIALSQALSLHSFRAIYDKKNVFCVRQPRWAGERDIGAYSTRSKSPPSSSVSKLEQPSKKSSLRSNRNDAATDDNCTPAEQSRRGGRSPAVPKPSTRSSPSSSPSPASYPSLSTPAKPVKKSKSSLTALDTQGDGGEYRDEDFLASFESLLASSNSVESALPDEYSEERQQRNIQKNLAELQRYLQSSNEKINPHELQSMRMKSRDQEEFEVEEERRDLDNAAFDRMNGASFLKDEAFYSNLESSSSAQELMDSTEIEAQGAGDRNETLNYFSDPSMSVLKTAYDLKTEAQNRLTRALEEDLPAIRDAVSASLSCPKCDGPTTEVPSSIFCCSSFYLICIRYHSLYPIKLIIFLCFPSCSSILSSLYVLFHVFRKSWMTTTADSAPFAEVKSSANLMFISPFATKTLTTTRITPLCRKACMDLQKRKELRNKSHCPLPNLQMLLSLKSIFTGRVLQLLWHLPLSLQTPLKMWTITLIQIRS